MMRHAMLGVVIIMLAAPAHAQQTGNPHGSLSLACAECHSADTWKPARVARSFKHAPETFPLGGAHARTSCTGCHKQLDFKGVSSRCASCHEDVHKGELGADCSRCHTPRSFAEEPAMKRAHDLTRFPLRGSHGVAPCSACHTPSRSGRLQFVGTSTACATCHASDLRAGLVPDHQTAGFPRDCGACHSSASWEGARFNHNATRFALTGAHNAVPCTGCHVNGVPGSPPMECASCHQSDLSAATNPPHASSLFTAPCGTCHTTAAWTGASFNHGATAFALTGAHITTSCASCHGDGVYRGKATSCVSCHQADYNQTANPNHGAASFPTTCAGCHGTVTWLGATFNHDAQLFPIYSGKHRGKWTSCATCHTSPTNFKLFTCLTCHDHRQSEMDGKHANRAGYRYESQACYACHPRGT
jgi:hypothetical protein